MWLASVRWVMVLTVSINFSRGTTSSMAFHTSDSETTRLPVACGVWMSTSRASSTDAVSRWRTVANSVASRRPGQRLQLDPGDVVHLHFPGADPGDLAGAVQRLDQAGAGDPVGFGAQPLQLGEAGLVGDLEQGARFGAHRVRDALGHHLVQEGVLRLAHPAHQAGEDGQAGQQGLVFEQVEHGPVEQRLGAFLARPDPGREVGAQVLLPGGELAVAEGVADLPGVLVGGLGPGAVLLQAARVDVELVGDEGHRAFGRPGGVVGLEHPEHAYRAPLHGPPQPGGGGAFARGQFQGMG